MKETARRIFILMLLIAAFAGCSNGPDQEVVIRDVVRIFYHEEGRYTFMSQRDGTNESTNVTVRFSPIEQLHIITDVEPGQKMWVKYTAYDDWNNGRITRYAEIHIRSPQDINGGGWSHGRFGSGTTSVIR